MPMRTTFAQFAAAFRSCKGRGDWRTRSTIGDVALCRRDDPSNPSPDYSDLVEALDDVVGGRSFLDPDAVALRAVFQPRGGL